MDFCMKRQWTTKRTLTLLCENRKYCLPFWYRRTYRHIQKYTKIIIGWKYFSDMYADMGIHVQYTLEFLVLFRENGVSYAWDIQDKRGVAPKNIAFIFIVVPRHDQRPAVLHRVYTLNGLFSVIPSGYKLSIFAYHHHHG